MDSWRDFDPCHYDQQDQHPKLGLDHFDVKIFLLIFKALTDYLKTIVFFSQFHKSMGHKSHVLHWFQFHNWSISRGNSIPITFFGVIINLLGNDRGSAFKARSLTANRADIDRSAHSKGSCDGPAKERKWRSARCDIRLVIWTWYGNEWVLYSDSHCGGSQANKRHIVSFLKKSTGSHIVFLFSY